MTMIHEHEIDFRFQPTTTASGSTPSAVPPRRRPRRALLGAIGILVVAIVAAAAGAGLVAASADDAAPVVIQRAAPAQAPQAPVSPTPGAGLDAAAIGAAVIPSVVTVEVGTLQAGTFVPNATGSGVVIDDRGNIATNDHVVGGASAVRVIFSNGTVYEAEIVGTDPVTDLAVVRINSPAAPPVVFGSAAELSVGEPAVAVGSPLGLEGGPSLSVGVISALGREVQTAPDTVLYGMLQTDAPITSGSSGGALVDETGRLIGITTAVGVSQIGVEGIGFATPVEIVDRITGELIANGSVSHAFLGITGSTAYEAIGDGGATPVGVLVQTIQPTSAAARAGVEVGDVVTSVDGTAVRTMDELITVLRSRAGGDGVALSLADGRDLAVSLGER
jgi:S1-C subfamily serine protease